MRRQLVAVFVYLVVIGWVSASEAAEFPYQAYVQQDYVKVRSGPGQDHYATGTLNKDDIVVVYRHGPEGYCASRPSRDSFSWIAAGQTELLDESIAKVKASGAAAFIGSGLGAQRDHTQVRLDRGERVQVTGGAQFTSRGDGRPEMWYKMIKQSRADQTLWAFLRLLRVSGSLPVAYALLPQAPAYVHGACGPPHCIECLRRFSMTR